MRVRLSGEAHCENGLILYAANAEPVTRASDVGVDVGIDAVHVKVVGVAKIELRGTPQNSVFAETVEGAPEVTVAGQQ